MNNPVQMHEVARCAPIATQRATFDDSSATNRAPVNATSDLKALAGAVLERNTQRNANATTAEKQRNFCNKHSTEKLRSVAYELRPEIDDPLLAEIWTPSGTPITIRADNTEHADWLKRMNPKPASPAPKPEPATASGARISEAGHNAQGYYFKWWVIPQNGTPFVSCAMPRQTLAETRTRYPDAAAIEPITGEEYADE
jgi:hypothetical protein